MFPEAALPVPHAVIPYDDPGLDAPRWNAARLCARCCEVEAGADRPCEAEPLARPDRAGEDANVGDAGIGLDGSTEGIEIVDELAFDAVPEGPFVATPAFHVGVSPSREAALACCGSAPPGCPSNQRPNEGASVEDERDGAPSRAPTAPDSDYADGDDLACRSAIAHDPFAAFASALCSVASSGGAGPDSLQLLRALLGLARIEDQSPGGSGLESLVAGKIVVATARGVARTPAFHAQVVAWRAVLRGDLEDVSACGAMTLDEWAADLVARTVGDPPRASAMRRELRALGVAAFGFAAAA